MNVATVSKASQRSQTPWWRQRELLRLNFIILSLVMFCKANACLCNTFTS